MTKILAFAGSIRRDSLNKRLVKLAAVKAREAGGEVTLIDLGDFALPLYDGDLEEAEGAPANATKLFELMKQHSAILLSCPEYNSSISGVLKNVIDWLSRPRQGELPLAAFSGKVAALLSASPGTLGGLRGLFHVRSILQNIGVLVIPNLVSVSQAHKAFADNGELVDEGLAKKVSQLAYELVNVTNKLNASCSPTRFRQ